MITELQLKIVAIHANVALWTPLLNETMERFEINNPDRIAAFIAQAAYESSDFRRLVENLNYSAERLTKVWPKRFPTLSFARKYENNPAKLANYVYSNRLGNGDETSGDGWKFRGRGIFQLTGRSNYRAAGKALRVDLENNPDYLEEPELAALSAGWYWSSRGLNELADGDDDNGDDDIIQITLRINGALTGLASRKEYLKLARASMGR
jgi:putative chitinase